MQLAFLTSGSNNTVFGLRSGFYLTTGTENFIAGSEAGYNIGAGSNNLMIGNDAGRMSKDLSDNIMLGHKAGLNLTGSGNSGNFFAGLEAGENAREQNGVQVVNNVVVGKSAAKMLTGSNNVVVGTNAGSASNDAAQATQCANSVILGTDCATTSSQRAGHGVHRLGKWQISRG